MRSESATRLPAAFNRLVWSNLAAQSAEQVGLAAAPIVAVLALGAGAGETGLLQTAQTLPFLLLSIPAGVLADRASRRRLMVAAEVVRGKDGGLVRATVEDEGPGIPAENLETVFERFYTQRPKGAAFGGNSGLGLSIARQIVTAHSGRIHAENREGGAGARLVVELPLAHAVRP